jgi:putative flavoprotein involved in K+ transport
VQSVRPAAGGGYRVICDAGTFTADAVVVATGYCQRAARHAAAERICPGVTQLDATSYRLPADAGRHVLVVGASATGVQLADELAASGRRVVLAVGRHTRMPRSYRGMDIFWWLEAMGTLSRRVDPARRRREPSLQLSGRSPAHAVDLNVLAGRGIALTGRLLDVRDGLARFADDLTSTTADADRRLNRLLDRIDEHATAIGLDGELDDGIRPSPTTPTTPVIRPSRLEVGRSGVDTVLWAAGYARSYPWLQVPGVLGPDGEIRQRAGITPAPGLVVLGMAGQTRLGSTYLDGVGYDAAALVDHLCTEVLRMPVGSRS